MSPSSFIGRKSAIFRSVYSSMTKGPMQGGEEESTYQ